MKWLFHTIMIAVFSLTCSVSGTTSEPDLSQSIAAPDHDLEPKIDVAPSALAPVKPVIVFLGDSLTAGFGLRPEAALPEQVKARLSSTGIDAVVINAGVSGDTTANGLARYEWSVVGADPDLVVIALGANDYLMGVSPDVTRANLAAILDRAKAADIAVVLVGVKLRSVAQTGSRDEDFSAVYQELSQSYNVPLYPELLEGVRDKPKLLQPDGLHPTEDGVAKIADGVAAFLLPTLQKIDY